MYRCTHKILNRYKNKLDCKLEKQPSRWIGVKDYKFRWSETIYSRMANINLIREEKLNQLGI
jgi:hypothetical protein